MAVAAGIIIPRGFTVDSYRHLLEARHRLGRRRARVRAGRLKRARPKVLRVLDIVCIHFGVLLKDLNSRRRTQQIAHARQVAMYITRRVLHLSYPMMGELFRRDHSTCVYAVKRITQQSKRRPEYGRTIDALALVVQNVLRAALSPKLALLAAIEKRGALAV